VRNGHGHLDRLGTGRAQFICRSQDAIGSGEDLPL
jgi:hypothetical protein